jgi:release factor glutamine methyltransferase
MFTKYAESCRLIEQSGIENPLFEALRFFDLQSGGALRSLELPDAILENGNFAEYLEKRKKGVPWEYIMGKAHFMGRTFFCTTDTLIPTDDTKGLVEAVLTAVRAKEVAAVSDLTLIEIGTGCGNIAISIALHTNHIKILASDISPAAVAVAARNVESIGVQNRVTLAHGDLFAPFSGRNLEGSVDFVVCNPPYIPTASLVKLSHEIIDHEPRVALDGGPYGINIFRRLISDALIMLKPGGSLFFEIGERQEKLVERLLEKAGGYRDVEFLKYGKTVRAIQAIRNGD